MSLTRRFHIRLDEGRYRRLREYAALRRASMAEVVREAIDELLQDGSSARREAGRLLLTAEEMPVGNWRDIKDEFAGGMA